VGSTDECIRSIVNSVKTSKKILLLGHIGPDGDSLSSQLAIYLALKKMGKDVQIWSRDPLPNLYSFLPASAEIKCVGEKPPSESFDIIFVMDVGAKSRVGFPIPDFSSQLINVDHHPGVAKFGTINCLDDTACATAEIVYRIVLELGVKLDKDIATNIYTGIITDTGSFRFRNTSKETFKIAAHLVECGVSPSVIAEKVFYSLPYFRLRLLTRCLNTLDMNKDDGVASVVLRLEDYAAENIPVTYTEDFINFPRSLEGVKAAVFFKEVEKDIYKVSLRSKGDVDVSEVARTLGGGGHINAASGTASGKLSEVKEHVFELLKNVIKKAALTSPN